MQIKRHIPNAITCLNLLSGATSIVYGLHEGDFLTASYLIILAAVFDFFDGLVARALGVTSPIGKDLDSLADVISFGLAPAILVLHTLLAEGYELVTTLPVLLIAAFAALRLAKFNNDTRQTSSFIGLPVPASALFWIGIHSIIPDAHVLMGADILLPLLYALVVLMGYLAVSEIPMFSLKLGGGQGLTYPIVLAVISVICVVWFGFFGCSLAILAYILLSVLQASARR